MTKLLLVASEYMWLRKCHRHGHWFIKCSCVCTVQLKGNVALMRYSTLKPRELNTPYSCSNAHDASKGQVVNHLRTDSLEYYPWLLVQGELYTYGWVEYYIIMILDLNGENEEPWSFGYSSLIGGFEYCKAQLLKWLL